MAGHDPHPSNIEPAHPPESDRADDDVTAGEVATWIDSEQALIDRFVRLRTRYLQGDDQRRRQLAVEAGVRNLSDINDSLKRCRTRLRQYETLHAKLVQDTQPATPAD